jgi:transcriptional regulator with PAS, ATPase and Fis domain
MLIIGETGTGKEEAARAIHRRSARSAGPFVAINCGGIPDSLLEAELFGYRKGAFTGATDDRPGLVEMAHRGTLFLDEVGELPPTAQVKLLRVLEERKVQRLGATEAVAVDFRLVAATHRDLGAHVAQGTFRQDLLFRIRVLEVSLPPLRERLMDLPLLVEYLIGVLAARAGSLVRGATADVMALFAAYPWPGNIRELRNVLERALVLEETDQLTGAALPLELRQTAAARPAAVRTGPVDAAVAPMGPASGAPTPGGAGDLRPYAEELAVFERDYIGRLRHKAGDNISKMARLSGISRFTLYRKLGEIGLAASSPGSARPGRPEDPGDE